MRVRKTAGTSERKAATISAERIASRVTALGKEISRECQGRRLDVVVTLDRGFRQFKGLEVEILSQS